jgi:glycosyltransferase involved in cell wall biosynthesis
MDNSVINEPLVSIVIPVYNGSNYLRNAIDSALAQTYKKVEVLVVNDGSSDDGVTELIALSYGNRIRYFSKENGGVASALNMGIAEMRGGYFSWLSHDDEYYPEKVAAQVEYLGELGEPEAILYSDFELIDASSRSLGVSILPDIAPGDFRLWITMENRLHGCTLFVPRDCFDRCGRFDIGLRTTQDYMLWFKMAERYSFFRVPKVLVRGRIHGEQGTRELGPTVLAECNEMLTFFVDELYGKDFLGIEAPSEKTRLLMRIARSFQKRGFREAYARASALAIEESSKLGQVEHLSARLRLSSLYAGYKGLFRIRRRISRRAAGIAKVLSKRRNESVEKRFRKIFKENLFLSEESRSGEGSTLEQTEVIRAEIPKLIVKYKIRSMLDAPCGDFHWLSTTDLGASEYIGADIVDDLISKDAAAYASACRSFIKKNIIEDDLPAVDMILCRDCLVHLTFEQGLAVIRNFKRSGAKYLLTTTFLERDNNVDLGPGDMWRTLNLRLAPFSFPEPIELINERCSEGKGAFGDKCLGLWKLEDIVLPALSLNQKRSG